MCLFLLAYFIYYPYGGGSFSEPANSEGLAQDSVKNKIPRIQNVACPYFDSEDAYVRCHRLTLPPVSEGDDLEFNVPAVVFSRNSEAPSKEVLIYIAGGPGAGRQTSKNSLEFWSYWYNQSKIQQDFLIFNPRALQGSSGGWRCKAFNDFFFKVLDEDVSYEDEVYKSHDLFRSCLADFEAHLKQHAIDKQQFLSAVSAAGQARDVNFIADALGYEAWHLWGVSFGSRVALLAADHPKAKSMILDSVYPLNVGGLEEWADILNSSMSIMERYYERSDINRGVSFASLVNKAVNQLEQSPLTIRVELFEEQPPGLSFSEKKNNLRSAPEGKMDFVLNGDRLKSLLISSLYMRETAEIFMLSVHEILDTKGEDAKYPRLKAALEYFLDAALDPGFSTVFYWLTECSDYVPYTDAEFAKVMAKNYAHAIPGWQRWLEMERELDICKLPFFEANLPVANSEAANYTDKPALIFSGELDAVTPPRWGDIAKENLPRSRHTVVENAAHGILQANYCDWSFWPEFLNTLNVNLELSCEYL